VVEQPESWTKASLASATLESLAAVGGATVVVALLDSFAPITGLGVIYLLAVLFVAIRRGEIAALATAFLSVLTLNFFFIQPRHRLTISDSENVVALAVFLITALAVGRLATAARRRAVEADQRAHVAAAREREARMLAAAASSLLDGSGIESQAARLERSVGSASGARVGLSHAPAPRPDEVAVRLPTSGRPGWLYHTKNAGWASEDQERVATALAGLIDLAVEREQLGAQAAEAEASRRADAVKTGSCMPCRMICALP
jgi:two-component system sensor histidine kinase KdpD